MADPAMPTEEELEALSQPVTAAPERDASSMPDPEPEVLERAQVLLDEASKGGGLQASLSNQPEEAHREVSDPIEDLTTQQKLDFVAHVLGGTEYREAYEAFRGRISMVFRTLSPTEEAALGELITGQEAEGQIPRKRRKVYYHRYALAASLDELRIDGESVAHRLECTSDQFLRDYGAWFKSLSGTQYRILDDFYVRFQTIVDTLLRKADDPDFWPTPSSP